MATQGGPLAGIIPLISLGMQRRQMQQQLAAQRINQLTIYADLASKTENPEQLTALRGTFSKISGLDEKSLDEIASNLIPTLEQQRARIAKTGYAQMSMEDRSSLEQGTASREFAGQTPFGMRSDQFLSELLQKPTPQEVGQQDAGGAPTEDPFMSTLRQGLMSRIATGGGPGEAATSALIARTPAAQEIGAGTRLSAPQEAQLQLGFAGNRLGWAELNSRDAIGRAQLDVERARVLAQSRADDTTVKELENLQTAINNMVQNQGRMSPSVRTATVFNINGMIRNLNSKNVFVDYRGQPVQMPYVPPEGVIDESGGFHYGLPGKGR